MPRSHDQKPRNRWRRLKGANPCPVYSSRPEHRRRLRRFTRDAQAFEADIRAVLAFEGKTWRHYERASRAEAERIRLVAAARVKSDTLRMAAA